VGGLKIRVVCVLWSHGARSGLTIKVTRRRPRTFDFKIRPIRRSGWPPCSALSERPSNWRWPALHFL